MEDLVTEDLTISEDLISDPSRVVARYRAYVTRGGQDSGRFREYAELFDDVGLIEQAVEAYGKAIDAGVMDIKALLGRGRLLMSLYLASFIEDNENRDFILQAVADLKAACDLKCGEIDALRGYILALLLAGDYQQCWLVAKESLVSPYIKANEDARVDLNYLLGFAELFLGNGQVAIEVFNNMPKARDYQAISAFGLSVCFLVCGWQDRFDELVNSIKDIDERLFESAMALRGRKLSAYVEVAAVYFSG